MQGYLEYVYCFGYDVVIEELAIDVYEVIISRDDNYNLCRNVLKSLGDAKAYVIKQLKADRDEYTREIKEILNNLLQDN